MRIRHIKGVEELIAAESLVIAKPEEHKGRWKQEVFKNDHPVYLEIGMGMGRFIRTHSFNNPDINYIGLELNTTVLYKAVQRYKAELAAHSKQSVPVTGSDTVPAAINAINMTPDCLHDALAASDAVSSKQDGTQTALAASKAVNRHQDSTQTAPVADSSCHPSNLYFLRTNARFLDAYFAKGEIDRIYLNFSDPWPKERSAGRRLTSPQFLRLYEEILAPDGVIEFKTDNRILFDYSVETIPSNGWKISAVSYDLHNDAAMNEGNVMTEYEEKFSSKGNPIFKLIASQKNI